MTNLLNDLLLVSDVINGARGVVTEVNLQESYIADARSITKGQPFIKFEFNGDDMDMVQSNVLGDILDIFFKEHGNKYCGYLLG